MPFHTCISILIACFLLAGCSFFDITNPFISQRPKQVVSGSRHAPPLNEAQPQAPANINMQQTPLANTMVRKPLPGNPYPAAAPMGGPKP